MDMDIDTGVREAELSPFVRCLHTPLVRLIEGEDVAQSVRPGWRFATCTVVSLGHDPLGGCVSRRFALLRDSIVVGR